MSGSKFKAMIIVFFYRQGIVYVDKVPEDLSINQFYYNAVWQPYVNRYDLKCRTKAYRFFNITHSTQCGAVFQVIFGKALDPEVGISTYSPVLALCDFFFSKIKSA